MTQEIQATGKPPAGVPRRSSLSLWSLEGALEFRFRRHRALQHRASISITRRRWPEAVIGIFDFSAGAGRLSNSALRAWLRASPKVVLFALSEL